MDRVSNLPDEVLSHVLSFLTTKEAAFTSVLAKRWRYMWALVPNLDIDDSVFLRPEKGKSEREEIRQSFVDFVNRALALQGNSLIKKFSLKYSIPKIHKVCVNRWLCNVLERGVSELDLFLDYQVLDSDSDELSETVFVTKCTLVKMKLETSGDFKWPLGECSFLPMLKTLVIKCSRDFQWPLLKKLLLSFPVLEELSISIYMWPDLDVTVSSASLKKLSVYSRGCTESQNPKSFSFDTPSLLYLEYSDFIAGDYPIVNLTELVEARFNLLISNYQYGQLRGHYNDVVIHENDDVYLLLGNLWKLFSGIRNVQKLGLCAGNLEALFLCCESMPVFNNLKVLHITSSPYQGWQAMPVLLRNCPHLETLVLQGLLHFETDKCGDACDCITRDYKGRSLLSSPVKMLQIKWFRGTLKESRMVKHFLESFPCLKEIEVYVDENDLTISESRGMSKVIAQMHKEFRSYDVKFAVYTLLV